MIKANMSVKFLDLKVEDLSLKKELLNRFEYILDHGRILDGNEINDFENIFAKTIGAKYAVGVGSGSSALFLALIGAGIGPGDEVITTPFTWIITVNAIAPGMIDTPMTQALSEDQKTFLKSRIPLGRLGEPEDIAAGVVYLASEEATYITGQTLHINGGMVMP